MEFDTNTAAPDTGFDPASAKPDTGEFDSSTATPVDRSVASQWANASPIDRLKLLLTHYPEASVKPFEEAQQPSVDMARIPKSGIAPVDAVTGVINAGIGAMESLTAPANAPLISLGPALGAVAEVSQLARRSLQAIAGFFGYEGAKGVVEGVGQARKVIADPDAGPQEVAEAITQPVLSAGMTALAGLGIKHVQELAREMPAPDTRSAATLEAVNNDRSVQVQGVLNKLAGESAPITTAVSEDAGNALVRYASAHIAAPEIARDMAGQVLGSEYQNPAFAKKLGSVLVEDRLRAIKKAFLEDAAKAEDDSVRLSLQQQADEVTTVMSEQDFKAALSDPEILAAIERHKALVQPLAEAQHVQVGGKTANVGPNTGGFVNLEALDPEGNPISDLPRPGNRKGELGTPLKKGSVFSQAASGSGENYTIDYNRLVERMSTGNYTEAAKRNLYDQLVSDGLAVELPPGETASEINGTHPVKFTIERRGIPAGDGATTKISNLWVDERVAGEVRQALNTDGPIVKAGLLHVANILNRIQLAGPVDAVVHTANILSSISGAQGGGSMLADLGRKLPGVNLVDTIARILNRSRIIAQDSPEVRGELARLGTIGALREEHPNAGLMGRFIQAADKAARLVRSDLFDNLVERGLVEGTEKSRREFVNKIGQYNPRLSSQIQRFFKESGIAPFVTAGRTFNRLALGRLVLDPHVSAANQAAWLKLRGVELAGTVATLIAVPAAINQMTVGNPTGRKGTPFGAIDTGKTDSNGQIVYIDPAQWTGLRRGMRITGANAILAARQRGKTSGETLDDAVHDIIGGVVHPWAGPAMNSASVLATGKNIGGFQQANSASYGQSQIAENAKAALMQLNPLLAASIQGVSESKDLGGAVKRSTLSLGGAFGLKETYPIIAENQIGRLAKQFNAAHGVEVEAHPQPSDYQKLTDAVRLGRDDVAKDALKDLLKTKSPEQVLKYYQTLQHRAFTGSVLMEVKFFTSLDSEQKDLYRTAVKTRQDTALKAFQFAAKNLRSLSN